MWWVKRATVSVRPGGADLAGAVGRAQDGDPEAFRALYRDTQPRLLRYLHTLVGDDAEDIASETWLQVTRDLAGFSGDYDGFRGWVATIARHRALDHLRYHARRPPARPVPAEDLATRRPPRRRRHRRKRPRSPVHRRRPGPDRHPARRPGRSRPAPRRPRPGRPDRRHSPRQTTRSRPHRRLPRPAHPRHAPAIRARPAGRCDIYKGVDAEGHEMNTRHPTRISRRAAEQLLDGAAGLGPESRQDPRSQDPLACVLAAAAAPGRETRAGG